MPMKNDNAIGVIGGMQKHQTIRIDGICPCLTEAMGMGGGHIPIIMKIKQVGNITPNSKRQNPQTGRVYDPTGIAPTLTCMEGGGLEPKVVVRGGVGENKVIRPILTPDRIEKKQNGRRFKEDGEPMFTLTAQDKHGIVIEEPPEVGGYLKVRNATKKGYQEAYPDDSVNLQYPESNLRRARVGKGISNTLQTSANMGTVTKDLKIRKLTPKECFRLQGWSDDYFEKAEFVNSDSQLYKQAGNGVTVNVIQAIARYLK